MWTFAVGGFLALAAITHRLLPWATGRALGFGPAIILASTSIALAAVSVAAIPALAEFIGVPASIAAMVLSVPSAMMTQAWIIGRLARSAGRRKERLLLTSVQVAIIIVTAVAMFFSLMEAFAI